MTTQLSSFFALVATLPMFAHPFRAHASFWALYDEHDGRLTFRATNGRLAIVCLFGIALSQLATRARYTALWLAIVTTYPGAFGMCTITQGLPAVLADALLCVHVVLAWFAPFPLFAAQCCFLLPLIFVVVDLLLMLAHVHSGPVLSCPCLVERNRLVRPMRLPITSIERNKFSPDRLRRHVSQALMEAQMPAAIVSLVHQYLLVPEVYFTWVATRRRRRVAVACINSRWRRLPLVDLRPRTAFDLDAFWFPSRLQAKQELQSILRDLRA